MVAGTKRGEVSKSEASRFYAMRGTTKRVTNKETRFLASTAKKSSSKSSSSKSSTNKVSVEPKTQEKVYYGPEEPKPRIIKATTMYDKPAGPEIPEKKEIIKLTDLSKKKIAYQTPLGPVYEDEAQRLETERTKRIIQAKKRSSGVKTIRNREEEKLEELRSQRGPYDPVTQEEARIIESRKISASQSKIIKQQIKKEKSPVSQFSRGAVAVTKYGGQDTLQTPIERLGYGLAVPASIAAAAGLANVGTIGLSSAAAKSSFVGGTLKFTGVLAERTAIAAGITVAGKEIGKATTDKQSKKILEESIGFQGALRAGRKRQEAFLSGGLTGETVREYAPDGYTFDNGQEFIEKEERFKGVGIYNLPFINQQVSLGSIANAFPFLGGVLAKGQFEKGVRKELEAQGLTGIELEKGVKAASRYSKFAYGAETAGLLSAEAFGGEAVGQTLVGGAFKKAGSKGLTTTVAKSPKLLGKLSFFPLFKAGVTEGIAGSVAQDIARAQDVNIKQAAIAGGFGGLSAGVVGSTIIGQTVKRPKVAKVLTGISYLGDPFELPGDLTFSAYSKIAGKKLAPAVLNLPGKRIRPTVITNTITSAITPTPTETKTRKKVPKVSISPALSLTPTLSPTTIPTLAPVLTPTPVPTFTPTPSPTLVPSFTPTPSPTFTPTPVPSPTETPTPTTTETPVPSPTLTPTPVPTVTPLFRFPPPVPLPLDLGLGSGISLGKRKTGRTYFSELQYSRNILNELLGGNQMARNKRIPQKSKRKKTKTTKSLDPRKSWRYLF